MLNPFPDLLTYSFFAPTLLRIMVAVIFAYLAWVHYQRRAELAHTLGVWTWVAVVLEALTAIGLFIGLHTQIVAIVGILMALPQLIYAKRHARAVPMCRLEYALVIVILLSILLTGAGGLAFDLRL